MRRGAWAMWAKRGPYEIIKGGALIKEEFHHVHQAELMALGNALHQIVKADWAGPDHHVLWQTDSQHAILILKKYKQAKTTMEELDYLIASVIFDMLDRTRLTLTSRHVKGHQGTKDPRSAVNTYCDNVCRQLLRHEKKIDGERHDSTVFREQENRERVSRPEHGQEDRDYQAQG